MDKHSQTYIDNVERGEALVRAMKNLIKQDRREIAKNEERLKRNTQSLLGKR